MRLLTASEKKLSLLFVGSIFLVLNFFLFEALVKHRKLVEKSIVQLKAEKSEASAWMADKEWWMKRRAWLQEKQPKPEAGGQESARLLEFLQQSARQQNITISQQKLNDPLLAAYYREVSVQLEVKGPLDAVTKWLAGLQAPDRFHAITTLTLKSDAEPPKVICSLTVARWYALP